MNALVFRACVRQHLGQMNLANVEVDSLHNLTELQSQFG